MNSELSRLEIDPIWTSFKKGSKAAFGSIYRAHIKALLNYGYKVTSDRNVIEDSIQDLFCELWDTREHLAETTSIKFYLFKALRYKICRNLKNSGRSDAEASEHYEHEACASHEATLIGMEIQSIQLENLKALLVQLPIRQQEAITLRFYDNFSNEEVARIMGVTYKSASNFIYLGLRKLKIDLHISTF